MEKLITDAWEEIDAFIYTGHIIFAIQTHRIMAKTSLLEAMEAVDRRGEMLRANYPERFSTVADSTESEALSRMVSKPPSG
jgi:hypothetical protein